MPNRTFLFRRCFTNLETMVVGEVLPGTHGVFDLIRAGQIPKGHAAHPEGVPVHRVWGEQGAQLRGGERNSLSLHRLRVGVVPGQSQGVSARAPPPDYADLGMVSHLVRFENGWLISFSGAKEKELQKIAYEIDH